MSRRFALVLLSFAVCWGIPEILVRIADPPLQQYRDVVFGLDPNSPLLFMRDPRLHWKLRPNADVVFEKRRVRTDPQGFQGEAPRADERTLLVLGDSTAFGWGVGEGEAFADILAARLSTAGPNAPALAPLRVVNAGMPGYSSFQVRLQAEALIPRFRPAFVIVCVGNNEAWPVKRSDRDLDASRSFAIALESLLSKSHFLLWASERLRPAKPSSFIAFGREASVARVSRDDYAENLRAIVRLAQGAGARVILLGPPVNLAYPPDHLDLQPDAARQKPLKHEIATLVARGELELALARAGAARRAAPESVYPIYFEGIVLSQLGRSEEGLERLEEALERNAYPERCKRSYREAARQMAAQEGVPFLDVNALFRDAARSDPNQAFALYQDWCHPTPAGHRLIADALLAKLEQSK